MGQRVVLARVMIVCAVVSGAVVEKAAFAQEPPTGWRADLLVTGSPFAVFDYPADSYGPSEKGSYAIGAGGGVSWRLARWFEVGVGLRYDFVNGDDDNALFVSAPLIVTFVVPLGRAGRELHFAAGVGVGAGWVAGYAKDGGTLFVLGVSTEAAVGYIYPMGTVALHLQAGIRLDSLHERNADPDSYLDNGRMLHGQLPFLRAGIRWR